MSAILEFADKLRSHVDIVDVVGRYVDLRRGGVNLKGLCPFHREKTPSFTVSAAKQIFHCFGCNEGGDVIKFMQKVERLEWIESVKLLAQQYNLPMPELRRDGASSAAHQDEKEKLLAVTKMAAEFFASILQKEASSTGTDAANYLEHRALDPTLVKRFQLGLAPDAWNDLMDNARRTGYERDTLVSAGLVIHNQTSQRFYDRFRKRLIFPIHDPLGRAIAFGGRVYASDAAPDEPKYVNSPETPLYHKGQALYALHLAKDEIARSGKALLMEGYMDVIRAHQHGFTTAVATCGTALTDEQARTLKRFCSEVVFVYDGDEAGRKAMLRGCEILLEQGFTLSIVGLPGDHDPDSYLQKEGADAFRAQVAAARNFVDFFLEDATLRFDRKSPEGKVRIVEALLPLLKRVGKSIAQNEYVRRVADFLAIDDALIIRQLSDANPRNLETLRKAVEEQSTDSRLERTLLRLAVESTTARQKVLERIQPDWLRHHNIRKWLERLRDTTAEEVTWDYLFEHADDDVEAAFLRALALAEEPFDASDRTLDNVAARLRINYVHQHNRLMAQQMQEFFSGATPHEASVDDLVRTVDSSVHSIKQHGQQYFMRQPGRE
ncbi:MAG: DNA primase [Candidatus Sumerlaeaceae bacterium]